MDALTIERTKAIYRSAIDARAADGEGEVWWREVQDEVAKVLSAHTLSDAEGVIDRWHSDWSMVGDTPRAAGKRLREAAGNAASSGSVKLLNCLVRYVATGDVAADRHQGWLSARAS